MDKLLRLTEAANILGVSVDTLRKWDYQGKIRTVRTKGGHRRIPLSEIMNILNIKDLKAIRAVTYARVSSPSNRDLLPKQQLKLREYVRNKGWILVAEIKDIGSGLNERRRGLRKLFKLVTRNMVDVVVITYKDRLTRFGFRYIEEFFRSYNVEIITINDTPEKSELQEYIEDFVSIMYSFAARLYGKRRGKKIIQSLKLL